ncbi:membrane protein insertase YidC [Aliidongia dinghuensis]|uniref:Membrane protein insertase YidC n=1 Tax=Aliidongia dinghuensis TaxID=1867774 RepID=A0A8J3E3S5_9PROT|nr:membrane protein insertase YidC [Aliidongia dinghuensis]GGF08861.1 membrane protein insertase YidC [Aliidongia dinghuensis]
MEQRNLVVFIVVAIAILLGSQYLLPHPQRPVQTTQQAAQNSAANVSPAAPSESAGNQLPSAAAAAAATETREQVLHEATRVAIDTPRMTGSINLKGARFDDLTLKDYRETIDPKSPAIVLLSPSGAPNAYRATEGWVAKDPAVKLPTDDTVWQSSGGTLTPKTPVTLTWDNGAGLTFKRTISVDENFLFTVKDTVANAGSTPVTLYPFGSVARTGEPEVSSTWVSYEGPIGGYTSGSEEVGYKDVAAGKAQPKETVGGWLGFSDKYWLTAVAPDQKMAITARFSHSGSGEAQTFQADYLGAEVSVAPGASIDNTGVLFAGAKEVKLLDAYTKSAGLPNFDRAVDFGWFYFLTKPIFYLLDWLYAQVGNFGIAILMLTVVIKTLFFPLANKAFKSMDKMKQLQPEMAKLKEQCGDDKVKLQQETMALYKRMGVNPVAGCLPMLLQIPVFFSLYKVLYVTIEMRHAPFFGWIQDLSAPDPTTLFNLFGLIPWTPPQFLMIGAWPAIYCLTMLLQQRMQPTPPDPTQARMMQLMPFIFTFMLGKFPAGLMIYYSWNNILTVGQQLLIRRRAAASAIRANA